MSVSTGEEARASVMRHLVEKAVLVFCRVKCGKGQRRSFSLAWTRARQPVRLDDQEEDDQRAEDHEVEVRRRRT
jgi:hypothetical protein